MTTRAEVIHVLLVESAGVQLDRHATTPTPGWPLDERARAGRLLEPMMQRSGFQIRQAEYSQDGVFAKSLLAPA